MYKIYKILFLVVVAVTAKTNAFSQIISDSTRHSVNTPDSQVVSDTISVLQNPAVTDLLRDTVPVSENKPGSEMVPDTTTLVQKASGNQFNDTLPTSVNVDLENIFNAKAPKEYIISDIKVTGTQSFDPNLIISITGLAKGDKVMIPGGDNFSKAISNLWKQSLISDAEIYLQIFPEITSQ